LIQEVRSAVFGNVAYATLGSRNLFPNFGTLQGDAIDSSDSNPILSGDPLPADKRTHQKQIFVGKLNGELWASEMNDLRAAISMRILGKVRREGGFGQLSCYVMRPWSASEQSRSIAAADQKYQPEDPGTDSRRFAGIANVRDAVASWVYP